MICREGPQGERVKRVGHSGQGQVSQWMGPGEPMFALAVGGCECPYRMHFQRSFIITEHSKP